MVDLDRFGYVIAPKNLVDNKLKVRFMYREESDNPQDSGWRFTSGDETEEYMNNPDNCAVYDVKTILAMDGDIEKYLDSPVGAVFGRKNAEDDFVATEFDI